MCGIAGWFNTENIDNQNQEALHRMSHAIRHRGPDGHGIFVENYVSLAHRRLAIIGIETGAQPMSSSNGRVTISFNGEIYNYIELAKKLSNKGFRFISNTDTEVILNLYLAEGIKGMELLRGMFSFALWDKEKKMGFLVRDPLGIKPLFYTTQNFHELIFASEAKAILAYGIRPKLSINSLHYLMNFRYLPGEKSMFEGIKQLPQGHYLHWSLSQGIQIKKLAPSTKAYNYPNLNFALIDSIEAHTVADVEIGSYLSGGIDSAYVTKQLSALNHPASTKTFTLDVGDDPLEAKNAAVSAQLLGVNNFQETISSHNCVDAFNKIIYHLEVPKINAWQTSSIAKLASRHVKVTLSGLGADELFFGYKAHQIFNLINLFRKLPIRNFTKLLRSFISHQQTSWSEPSRILSMLDQEANIATVYGLLRNCWDTPDNRKWIYGQALQESKLDSIFTWLSDTWDEQRHPLHSFQHFEWEHKMANDLLWQEDRLSMAEGLEVRTPFVDTRLKSYIDSLKYSPPMPLFSKKYYFKKAINKELPHTIIRRPKSGFQVHAGKFFNSNLKEIANHYLSSSVIAKHQLFNLQFVNQILALPPSKKNRWHYFMLYLIIGTHAWIDIFEN